MKLSVAIVTYNHDRFIAEALESALMQQTSFDYEIVVGEDCSTDNTRAIVAHYQQRYPEKVKLLHTERNLGMLPNFVRTLQTCRGDYLALLDGDDYWISSSKLQEQVDFLDSHPEYAMCFHNIEEFYEDNSREPHLRYPHGHQEVIALEDLLIGGQGIQSSSVVSRNRLIDEFPDWYYHLPYGDITFQIFCAQFGKVRYLDKVMSRYRRHSSGAWTGANPTDFLQAHLRMYKNLDAYFQGRYKPQIRSAIALRYYWLACDRENNADRRQAISYALKRLYLQPFRSDDGEHPLKHLARLCTPQPLYTCLRKCSSNLLGRTCNPEHRTMFGRICNPGRKGQSGDL